VADLCCGIGGDLVPLAGAARAGAVGVDRDPLTAAVAEANAAVLGAGDRVEVRCEDVADTDLTGLDGVFLDPARRGGGRRALDPRSWSPPFSFVLDVAARVPATGAKLAPGVPHGILPLDAEAEWVSDRGDVVECALWCGPLATGVRRRATLLPSGATLTGGGDRRGVVGPVGALPGRAGRRGDQGRAGRRGRGPGRRPAARPDDRLPHVWGPALDTVRHGVRGHRRAAVRPQAAAHPAARAGGRAADREEAGTAVQPEALRKQLRLHGDEEATIVLTRIAGQQSVLTRPAAPLTSCQRSTATT
jgi:hypothetical protein